MLFLILRFLPFIIPIAYFSSIRAIFYFDEYWTWVSATMVFLPVLYFGLLKYKNKSKEVLFLGAYGLIFAATGFSYVLILENQYAITLYLLIWSLVYGLYLEAVFHDFYETSKAYVLNLKNITLFGGMLTVFFLTAALNSFNIFLSLPWFYLLSVLAASYFIISYLIILGNSLNKRQSLLYSGIIGLIITEIVSVLMLLPSSFYIIAIITTLVYYVMVSLFLTSLGKVMQKNDLWRYLIFAALALLLAVLTANWF